MMIVLASCGNGYCGCDGEEVFFFEENTEETIVENDVYEWARENAESFSHVHFGWDEEYTYEEYEDYLENYITYDWHKISYDEYLEWCENYGVEPKKF